MSLRFVPTKANPSSTAPTLGAPSAPGVHDTLRANLSLTAPAASSSKPQDAPVQSSHPLEARLAKWRQTQDSMKMEGLRRVYGIGEPVRRGMELKIAAAGEWKPMQLGGSAGVHGDILSGRDTEIQWEDIFKGDELKDLPDFHTEMEARMKMQW